MATCPSCGKENPDGFRFCGFCTAPLTEAPTPLLEERKIVSVLFCDLVGFTARSDSADPEDVRARIRPYHARLRTELGRFGATVEKFIGDAVMAVFGAPLTHEDDAERAVRAGLRIVEAIEELNDAEPGLELQVRVGIATGQAVVALAARPEQGEGIVTGDVVNTAARLQSAAPVGGVAVGEQTYRTTSELFDYEQLEPVGVKGKAEPLARWRPTAARSRFGTDVTRTHTTPLVGRELEKPLLIGTCERAAQQRSVQLVTVVGEPGVGKSRLVGELFAYIDAKPELTRWRQGRCLPYGEGIAFWALGEIVKAEAGILESDSAQVAGAKLDAAVPPDEAERQWLLQRLLPLVGVESASVADRQELFTAWRRFLESLAASRPTVLVFEDLHWADEALLAFLEHLAEWAEGVPLLVVCTARPELYEQHPRWAGGTRNATTINLAPLSDAETGKLVSALFVQAELTDELERAIVERAGGNPLYAEEYVRLLNDRGLGAWEDKAGIAFPESVQALIAARLDTLAPERKSLLQDAAVLGKVFWAGALAQMGGRDAAGIEQALHELSRKELIRSARTSSMEGEAEYVFWHALVRDVAYSQIPRSERARRHRAAARWIEAKAGERVEDLAELLAHHYLAALELTRDAGKTDEAAALAAPARRFLQLAGERALGLDTNQAEALLAQALSLCPPGDPERPAALARWADAARQTGSQAESARALHEAVAGLRAQGETLAAAQAMITLADVLWRQGGGESEHVAQEAVTILEALPPAPELVFAYAETARLRSLAGSHREAIGWAERAIALAAELGIEEPAKALGYRGLSRGGLGDADGLDDLRRAAALATERGQGWEAGVLYNNLAVHLGPIEGPAAALAAHQEAIVFSERRGITETALWTTGGSLDHLFQVGRWDEALEVARGLAERLEAQPSLNLAAAHQAQAHVLVLRGRADEGLPLAEQAVEVVREATSADAIALTFSVAAQARLATGDRLGAAELLAELEQMPHGRASQDYVWRLPEMVRTAVAASDLELAHRLPSGVEPLFPLHQHSLHASRAILAEAAGELAEAVSLYADAADRWARFGFVPEHAHALLGQGRCLLAFDRPGAEVPLAQARELFSSLGYRSALDETEALLNQTAAPAP